MPSSEKEQLLNNNNGEGGSSCIDDVRRNLHLIMVVVLLLSCLGLVATLIALDTQEMQDIRDRKDAAQLALQAGSGLTGVGDEVTMRLLGTTAYTSQALSAAVSVLAGSSLANATYRNAVASNLVTARATTPTNLQVFLTNYAQLSTSLLLVGYSAVARGSETSSHSNLGLVCFGSHAQRLSAPLHYLSDYVRPSWDADMYRAFLGSMDNEPCGQLLPETMWEDDESQLLSSAPGLTAAPNPAVYDPVAISRSAADLVDRGLAWTELLQRASSKSLAAYDDDLLDARVALGTSCAAAVLILAMLAVVPVASKSTDSARSDIRNIFRQIETTVKLISKYIQVLHTCSVREGEWKELQAAQGAAGGSSGALSLTDDKRYSGSRFLWHVVEFVQAVRPYVPQSSFGDIENVPITGQSTMMGNTGSLRMDSAAASQAIRELRLRDLRPDMGMQIVNGTVMYLSLTAFHRGAEANGDNLVQDSVKNRFAAFLAIVERCINGTTGVIHTITGEYLIALWNVTSSTSSPRVCAVYAALQLYKALSQAPLNFDASQISLSIAQSFLLAGNVEIGGRKQLAICGPAVVLAEKLEGCNAAHRTSIMIDQACAESVTNTVITDFDFAVRAVVLLKVRDDSDDVTTGFAVHPHRIRQERLKAWNTLFKDLSTKLHSGALADALLEVEEYKNKHTEPASAQGTANSKTQRAATGRNAIDRSAESWKRNLIAGMRMKESSQRLATEFGV